MTQQQTQFFVDNGRHLSSAMANLICLQQAVASNNQQDIERYGKAYADDLQNLTQPHIEKAAEGFTDEDIQNVLGCVPSFTDSITPKVRVFVHDQIQVPCSTN